MKNTTKFQPKINNCAICDTEYFQSKYNLTRCEKCKTEGLKRCQKHNDVILGKHKSCPKCSHEKSLQTYTEANQDDWIECPLCGYRAGDLGPHIIKHHNMTTDEFREKTGFVSIKSKNQCERVVGNKNPAYQHGGKYSPFSEKFIYADTTNIDEIKEKAAQARKDNENDTTTLAYWLKKTDGNVEEAKNLLSERQSTFSLEKCIEKYGEEKGTKRWVKRQEKWQSTLNSKSNEEIEEINKKKSTKINYETLWFKDIDSSGIFYVLLLDNSFIKIGVTTKSNIENRYQRQFRSKFVVLDEKRSTINHCFHIEQIIKQRYKDNIISKNEMIDGFGWTETLKNINIETFLDEAKPLYDLNTAQNIFNELYK